MRRVGALMTLAADGAVAQARNAAFLQGLQQSGWTVGRNLRIEYRWAAGSADDTRKYAAELAALAPDCAMLANWSALSTFARSANGGLIVTSSGLAITHREMIVMLAAKHQLPAVYYSRGFVAAGGLISYGSDRVDQFRSAAGYVDRILKGDKPADIPVQEPTKYELVINLKTAKALGLDVPPTLLARADEVIE